MIHGPERDEARRRARKLANDAVARGEPLAWFHEVYELAEDCAAEIPWAENAPNPHLCAWLDGRDVREDRALVVGCGLGDDAHLLAQAGAHVTAFDLSPMAIDWCRRRFPDAPVRFTVSDLFHSPAPWTAAFDLVVEVYTLQSLHRTIREAALLRIASFVRPGGTLLVIARGRDPHQDAGRMPWPLTMEELAQPLAAQSISKRSRISLMMRLRPCGAFAQRSCGARRTA